MSYKLKQLETIKMSKLKLTQTNYELKLYEIQKTDLPMEQLHRILRSVIVSILKDVTSNEDAITIVFRMEPFPVRVTINGTRNDIDAKNVLNELEKESGFNMALLLEDPLFLNLTVVSVEKY